MTEEEREQREQQVARMHGAANRINPWARPPQPEIVDPFANRVQLQIEGYQSEHDVLDRFRHELSTALGLGLDSPPADDELLAMAVAAIRRGNEAP